MPYTINLISNYLIAQLNADEEGNLSHLKLQKLIYYIQAWSLGIKKQVFFESPFYAWVHGPVNLELYDRFKDTKTLYSEILISDISEKEYDFKTIKEEDLNFIQYILENYAKFSGTELEAMTHREQPWLDAREGLNEYETGNNEISPRSMMDYYGSRWEKVNGKETR